MTVLDELGYDRVAGMQPAHVSLWLRPEVSGL